MPGPFKILGIPGTLRKKSFNAGLLRATSEEAPDGVEIEIFHLGELPLFNEDVEALGDPDPVTRFKQAITEADALLIASAEYNYSVTGVLKNAIDWASRPPGKSSLRHKPIGIFGASPSGFGTVRAQHTLRQIFGNPESYVMLKPELWISAAHKKFDDDGNLTDDEVRAQLRPFVEGLVAWEARVRDRS